MPPFTRNMRLLIDQFDFSLDTSGITMTAPGEAIEVATLQMGALSFIPVSAGDAKIEHTGYYSGPNVGQIERELNARLGSGSAAVLAVLTDTAALGSPALVIEGAWADQLKIDAPIKELITLTGSWPAGNMRRGKTLLDGVRPAGASSAIDLVTAGVAGCSAFLLVRAIAGASTGIVVQLQGATDAAFTTPVLLGSWASFTAVGAYTLDVSGSVPRYLRVNVTLNGATGLTASCIACVKGVTE